MTHPQAGELAEAQPAPCQDEHRQPLVTGRVGDRPHLPLVEGPHRPLGRLGSSTPRAGLAGMRRAFTARSSTCASTMNACRVLDADRPLAWSRCTHADTSSCRTADSGTRPQVGATCSRSRESYAARVDTLSFTLPRSQSCAYSPTVTRPCAGSVHSPRSSLASCSRTHGRNIRNGRMAVGLPTQQALAEALGGGVVQSAVARWERGEIVPRDDMKLRIAEVLHQEVRQIFPLRNRRHRRVPRLHLPLAPRAGSHSATGGGNAP